MNAARNMHVRQYEPADRDAVYGVSVRTAHADHHSRTNPGLESVPVVFAGPYLALEPNLAFVLMHKSNVVGFIVGTADTTDFVRAFREQWLPQVAAEYPPLHRPATTPAEHRIGMLHRPEWMLVPELQRYPAHLHINILRDYQRQGGGRALMAALLGALAERRVPGVHLGVPEHNKGALAFHDRLGFRRVDPRGGLIYLGRSIAPAARRIPLMWQTSVLAEIEAAALVRGAVSVCAVGSVAAGAVDDWSDLDAMIVVPDGQTAEFWPDMDWLPDLGGIALRSSGRFPRPTAVASGLLLADGRKVDITVVEDHRAGEHLAMLSDLRPAVNGTDGSALGNIASKMVFDAVTAIGRSARGERLLATQLAFGLYVRCLDAAMVIRDLETGTCVHPGPSEHDGFADLLPPTPGGPEPADVLKMISAALDCFEQVLADSPAQLAFPRSVLDQLIATAEATLR